MHVGDEDFDLSENLQLNETLAQFDLPIVTHSTIESDGYGMCSQSFRFLRERAYRAHLLTRRSGSLVQNSMCSRCVHRTWTTLVEPSTPCSSAFTGGPARSFKFGQDWHDYIVSDRIGRRQPRHGSQGARAPQPRE